METVIIGKYIIYGRKVFIKGLENVTNGVYWACDHENAVSWAKERAK